MKKTFIVTVLLSIGLLFSGLAAAENIAIVGTGDGINILQAIGKAFSLENPGVSVTVSKSIGSGSGIKAVGEDREKMGRVARGIKDSEKQLGLTYVPFAKVATVFFVNKNLDVTDLSAKQVCDIYSGKITNWREVGGKDARIRVVRREGGDRSLGALLETFPGFKDITLKFRSKTAFTASDCITTVENVNDTIGWAPQDVIKNANVNVLAIDGKKPGDAGYPSSGELALIFKEKNNTGNIRKFVEFATSSSAQDVIKSAGGTVF